ncbi:hypothetical protein WDU94_005622 [Cyamophila willieti]
MCEILAQYYVKNSANSIYPDEFIVSKVERELSLKSPSNTELECYNLPFTYNELTSTFATCRSHAPGKDGVCYQMIMQLPQDALEKLLDVFNFIWKNGVFPKGWKTALIVPILKPNKNSLIAENYRPISLLSCSNKIMEKMISKRLKWLVENKQIIDMYQSGNRRQRSTIDNLVLLEHEIAAAYQNNEVVIAVFLDITKFFDRVSKVSVLEKLIENNIGGPMYMYIDNFLTYPQISVKIDTVMSSNYPLANSIRQGSSLSGDLCNIATSDIAKFIPSQVSHGMFVDDLAIYMRGRNIEHIQIVLQKTLNNLMKWSQTNGLTFSHEKTVAVNFNKRRSIYNPRLIFQNHVIQYQECTKWLGLNLDASMTWNTHINQIKSKSLRALNVMKILSNRTWGLRRETLRRLYFAYVLPILDYGSVLYSSACDSQLAKLNVVHNSAVRLISGAFRTSPIVSLLAEAAIPPLSVRRKILALNYVCNVSRNVHNPVYLLLFNRTLQLRIDKPRYPLPLRNRVETMPEYNELKAYSVLKTRLDMPPWLLKIPSVTYLVSTPKCDLLNQEAVQNFLEFRNQNQSEIFCFTDGSKTANHTGAAYSINDNVYKVRLGKTCSVFTAELTAIKLCLEKIQDYVQNNLCLQNFIICSDSKSSLQACKNMFTRTPLVYEILTKIHEIREIGTRVSFLWIPSHMGIQGNDLVDQAARNTVEAQILELSVSDDYRAFFKSVQLAEWDKSWKDGAMGQKLRRIKPDVRKWETRVRETRAEEIVVCRLRIGHCLATHKHLLERRDPPSCEFCGETPLTVEHWLVQCTGLCALRRKYKLGNSIFNILKDDECAIKKCVGFIKEANLFTGI